MKNELEKLELIPASEIISEVERPNEEEADDFMVEDAVIPNLETKLLVEEVIHIGCEFKPAHEKLKVIIEKHRFKILSLKEAFGVRQGCGGAHLIIGHEPFNWEEFILTYFGVTSRRLNQLLDARDSKNTHLIVVPTPETEKPLFKKGKIAGIAEARRQMTAELLAHPLPAIMTADTADAKGDVYDYFEQLKEERETYVFELAAMVLEMFDSVDAAELGNMFAKELKKQIADGRTALATAATC
jgi:hypothetical protein